MALRENGCNKPPVWGDSDSKLRFKKKAQELSVASVLLKKKKTNKKKHTVITDPEETRLTLQNALKVTDPLKTESVRANWHLQNVKTASFCFFEGGFIEKKKKPISIS